MPGYAILVGAAGGVGDPHTLGRIGFGQGPDTLCSQAQLGPCGSPGRVLPGPEPDLTSGQVPTVWEGVTSILVMMLNTLPP